MVRRYKGRKPARRSRPTKGRKSVGRRRQPARVAKRGLPKRQMIQSNLGGLSLTRFSAARRAVGVARHIKGIGQPNFVNITYPGLLQAEGGKQFASSWYLNGGNDMRRIWATIQGLLVQQTNTTFAEYALSATQGAPTPNASFRFVLESAVSQLNLANTGGTPVNVELYDCVAKRDSGQLPTTFDGSLANGGGKYGQSTLILDPYTAWELGMKNESGTATGFEPASRAYETSATLDNLGSTPYQSKLFKDYFKVVRKTNVSLPIGGQHKHFVDLKPNCVFDNDIIQQNNVYKGVSFFTLVVVSGIPVVKCPDSDATHGLRQPDGDVTTSAVSVSILQQVRYKWTWVEDSRENIYRANYINYQNESAAQTTQPAMMKMRSADTLLAQSATSDGIDFIYTAQPSECTR